MSRHPFIKPATPALSAFLSGRPVEPIGFVGGRAVYPIAGGADDPPAVPERPDGISEETWDALGDPGKQALARERATAEDLRRQLHAAKARPAPPKADPTKQNPPKADPQAGTQPDVAALIQQAVAEAVKPFQAERDQLRAEQAAQAITTAVTDAAKDRLHDATDALAHVDLATLTDGNGKPDADKIKTAIDALVQSKPHLAKPAVRQGPLGVGSTPATGGGVSLDDQVKATLAAMQKSVNLRPATSGQ